MTRVWTKPDEDEKRVDISLRKYSQQLPDVSIKNIIDILNNKENGLNIAKFGNRSFRDE